MRRKFWGLQRHPILYYIRYILLAKNTRKSEAELVGRFDKVNQISDIPKLYFEVNKTIGISDDADEFDKALQISSFLRSRTPVGPSLSSSSKRTLYGMLYGKGGVCNDFSMVFNNFCLINNIPSKEWNCVDRFYKTTYGHTFNEIFSSRHQKWIAIDSHKGIYFLDNDNSPMSVIELFESLRNHQPLRLAYISGYRPPNPERLKHVFSGKSIPFVTHNYKAAVVDNYLEKFQSLPMFLINALLILQRKNYSFVFVLDDYRRQLLPESLRNA
ncbi:MAG: transglutaminase domain-containing protein [Flavobacterium sp.]|nr:transglutaminase domain-containing protein [Flavobacterium sp.]